MAGATNRNDKRTFPERSLVLPYRHRLDLLPGAAGSLGCAVSCVVSVVTYGYGCSDLRMAAVSAAPDARHWRSGGLPAAGVGAAGTRACCLPESAAEIP